MENRVVNFKVGNPPPIAVYEPPRDHSRDGYIYADLTLHQIKHLEFGTHGGFSTIDDYRRAWEPIRERVISIWMKNHMAGTRPAAWWILDFEWSLPDSGNPFHFGRDVPDLADQPAILAAHDLLTEDELRLQAVEAATTG